MVLGTLAASVVLGVAVPVHAAAEAVHFVYEAAPSCPSEREFVAAVLARTQKVALVDASQAERIFALKINSLRDTRRGAGVSAGFSGLLAIHRGEDTTTREVKGATCAAVSSALALVTALAIDPDSLRLAPAPAAAPPPPAAAPLPVPEHLESGVAWQWRVGGRFELGQFVAPRVPLGVGAFLELGRADDRHSILGLWALRIGPHYAATGSIDRAAGPAHFNWAALRLEGCVLRLRLAPPASLDACAAFDVGGLRGSGEVSQAKNPTTPWFSVAPVLRLPCFLSGGWFLEAEVALILPLRRETFVFEPRDLFYQVAPAGPAAAFGLGYAFP
jgi:hypothetical protein